MRSKRGEGYIIPCVLVIILCVVLSVLIMFANAIHTAKLVKRNSITVLDSYVTANAVEIFNSIKQGNDYISALDEDEYVEKFIKFGSLEKQGSRYVSYDGDGKTQYEISRPQICFVTDKSLKIKVEYTVYVPIYFGGARFATAEVPVTVESRLNAKK